MSSDDLIERLRAAEGYPGDDVWTLRAMAMLIGGEVGDKIRWAADRIAELEAELESYKRISYSGNVKHFSEAADE